MWSEKNHLQLNAKTKLLGVDMRRNRRTNENYFYGVCVQSVEHGKCHVQTDNKLDFIKKTQNTETLFKKGQSFLYFLRLLRSFNIC